MISLTFGRIKLWFCEKAFLFLKNSKNWFRFATLLSEYHSSIFNHYESYKTHDLFILNQFNRFHSLWFGQKSQHQRTLGTEIRRIERSTCPVIGKNVFSIWWKKCHDQFQWGNGRRNDTLWIEWIKIVKKIESWGRIWSKNAFWFDFRNDDWIARFWFQIGFAPSELMVNYK